MRRAGDTPHWAAPPRSDATAVGYAFLIATGGLQLQPRQQLSFLTERSQRATEERNGVVTEFFPRRSYDPGPSVEDHLEFALKYDGVDIAVLRALFRQFDTADVDSLTRWIAARPTSQYSRRAWFLYEWLTGSRLGLPDAKMGNYVPLFDEARYYAARPLRSRRHRVNDNALGPSNFCPVVRRSKALESWSQQKLSEEASELISEYDPATLRRAVSYLYTKETKSTYSIEGEVVEGNRAERFIEVLRRIHELRELSEEELVRLQHLIVSEPFWDAGWRRENVYVGEQLGPGRQRIHFIAPRHQDVDELMQGWRESLRRLRDSDVPAIIQAAVASFAFVFLHPFRDGNGRLHRLVIHHVLNQSGFAPTGIVLPVSAVMLERRYEYDAALESVSRPLMPLIQFEEKEDGSIEVLNDTADLYRDLDYSRLAEDLWRWTAETIRSDLKKELTFVQSYDSARRQMQAVVDMPDRLLNNFIRIVTANGGTLSKAKRKMFDMLSDDQISRLEAEVRTAFGLGDS